MLRLIMIASFTTMLGCAQQMKSVQVQDPQIPVNGEIRGISVSDDASRIDINSDSPIVYTFYLQESPPGVVIDLAQVSPGSIQLPIEINKGSVKRIEASKHEFGSGILSRIVVSLNDKVDVNANLDPVDNRHLAINLVGAAPARPGEAKEDAKVAQVKAESDGAAKDQPTAQPQQQQQNQQTAVAEATGNLLVAVKQPDEQKAVAASTALPVAEDAATKKMVDNGGAADKKVVSNGIRALKEIKLSSEGINLILSGEVDAFKAFKLTNPERVVIDIAKTKNEVAVKSVEINAFNVSRARIGGSPEKLRIVLDATGGSIPPYALTKVEKGMLISFGDAARAVLAAKAADKSASTVTENVQASEAKALEGGAAVAVAKSAPEKSQAEVEAASGMGRKDRGTAKDGIVDFIEFKQSEGVSSIIVTATGACAVSEPVKTAKGAYVSLKGCKLPANLQRHLDTRGFTSVISEILPYPVKTKGVPEVRIAVKLRQVVKNQVKRDNGGFSWEFREPIKPVKMSRSVKTPKQESVVEKTAAVPAANEYMEKEIVEAKETGQKSRLDKGAEEVIAADKLDQQSVRPVKQYTGRKVSLEFSDADIRKIFQLIAEVSNQNFLVSDDVSGTISLKLVNVPWDQALDVILENKGLGMKRDGNIVQIRPRNKMKSLDDEAIELRLTEEKKMPLSTVIFDINFATLADIETQFKALKSKRGDSSISSDSRTNKIIVVDIEPNIKKMRALLSALDVPEKQVMIEARIVEASSSFVRDIGVKWNFGYQDGSASVANISNFTSSMGGVVSTNLPTLTTGGIAAGMSFGKLISNVQLDLRLSAASSVGQVKIISAPKVLTVNNKRAKISQGQMIPYQNTSSAEGAKTEFIAAELSLEVTPHITADNSVSMKIKASNNSAGTGNPPPINNKEATTELVVKNGETTVIGGIYVDSETDGDTGVPFLSDIPLLGWLFKSNTKNKVKNELLIFITPKIVG